MTTKAKLHVSEESCTKLLQKIFGPATSISQFTRIENGLNNPIYIFSASLQHQSSPQLQLVLKVCNPVWKTYKTLNEAQVIQLLEANSNQTRIPVPHIFYCHTNSENEIGFEYILMSKLDGVPLSSFWDSLSLEERVPWLEQVADILVELRSLPNWQVIDVTNKQGEAKTNSGNDNTGSSNKMPPFGGSFRTIKTVQNNETGAKTVIAEMGENCDSKLGPFYSLSEFYCSLIDSRIPEMQAHPKYKHYAPLFQKLKHQLFLNKEVMEAVEAGAEYCLNHQDLDPKNLLVDPVTKKITGVIDWEWSNFGLSDNDISEVESNFHSDNKHNNKEFEIICEAVQKKMTASCGHHVPPLQYNKRKEFEQICSNAMRVVSFETWFVDEEEREKYRETLERRLTAMFDHYNIK